MAVDTAPLAFELTDFAAKIETTTGTPIALAAADGVTPIFNADMKPQTEKVERPGYGALGKRRQGLGARMTKTTLIHEGYGAATAPSWATYQKLCGLALTSRTLAPVSRPTATGTLGLYRNGVLQSSSGNMGNCVWTFERGKAPRLAYELMGVSQPDADVTQILPTYDSTIAPEVTASFTVGGVTYYLPQGVFDQGNNVVMREHIAGVDSAGKKTGYRSASILGRRPTLKISPETLPISTKDWKDIFLSRTTAALSIVAGDTANNIITLAAPKLELDTDPEDANRNGIWVKNLTFLVLMNTDAGDDDYSIVFS